MSIKDKAKEALRRRLGDAADPGKVLDELIGGGMSGDNVVRRYAVRTEFERRFKEEPHSVNRIQEEIADEFGLSRQGVANIVLGK